jgi:hypothetical protein
VSATRDRRGMRAYCQDQRVHGGCTENAYTQALAA